MPLAGVLSLKVIPVIISIRGLRAWLALLFHVVQSLHVWFVLAFHIQPNDGRGGHVMYFAVDCYMHVS